MRTVAQTAACAIGLLIGATQVQSADPTNVLSDPVGFYKVNIGPGANFIAAPLQPMQEYRGARQSSTINSVTFSNTPNFVVNKYAPADGFNQYILIARFDADKTIGAADNITGDWWTIVSNTTNTVTVNPMSDNLSTYLGAGDQFEIRRLTSLKDLLGTASSCILNKDTDFDVNPAQEDIIRYVVGTGFTKEIFYHSDVPAADGYYVDGAGPFDGSTITLEPDEAFVLQRKVTSTNMVSLGQVQTTRLTHYMVPGPNTFANAYPANAPISTSNLKESGFVQDTDFDINPAQDDIVRSVIGTGFVDEIFYHSGAIDTAGWYVGGSLNDAYPFVPGRGYVYFVKSGTGGRVWRQTVPFTP